MRKSSVLHVGLDVHANAIDVTGPVDDSAPTGRAHQDRSA
jgi:hypothetical protein